MLIATPLVGSFASRLMQLCPQEVLLIAVNCASCIYCTISNSGWTGTVDFDNINYIFHVIY